MSFVTEVVDISRLVNSMRMIVLTLSGSGGYAVAPPFLSPSPLFLLALHQSFQHTAVAYTTRSLYFGRRVENSCHSLQALCFPHHLSILNSLPLIATSQLFWQRKILNTQGLLEIRFSMSIIFDANCPFCRLL